MRNRLTISSIIIAALIGAGLYFALSSGQEEPNDRQQPEFFPNGLGIVAAFTATAQAGGAALDPTALATPTILSDQPTSTPVAAGSPTTESGFTPVLNTSGDDVTPGESFGLEVTGAAPDEEFDIALEDSGVVATGDTNELGAAKLEIQVPDDLPAGSVTLTYSGSQSGSSSVTINVAGSGATVSVDPAQPAPGMSVSITGENFSPGEPVEVSIGGEGIGSAIAGNDGGFSITTRLPDDLATDQGSQLLSLRGESGSSATSELTLSTSPEVAAAPTATAAAQQAAPENESQPEQAGSELPEWLYIVIGAVGGWLGLLTIWVYRLDRTRDRRYAILTDEQGRIVTVDRPRQLNRPWPPHRDDDAA